MIYGRTPVILAPKGRRHCDACAESWLESYSMVCPDCGATGELGEVLEGGGPRQSLRPTLLAQSLVERESAHVTCDADVAAEVVE